MHKLEAIKTYLTSWVDKESKLLEEKVFAALRTEKTAISNGFMDSLKAICEKTADAQVADGISYISYSHICFNFLNKQPLYLIESFNEDWFFSSSISTHTYDPAWLTDMLHEFYDRAQKEHRRYVEKINATEVEKIMLILLDTHTKHLMSFVEGLLRETKLDDIDEYNRLNKDELKITMGNYRGLFRVVRECKEERGEQGK